MKRRRRLKFTLDDGSSLVLNPHATVDLLINSNASSRGRALCRCVPPTDILPGDLIKVYSADITEWTLVLSISLPWEYEE